VAKKKGKSMLKSKGKGGKFSVGGMEKMPSAPKTGGGQ
jgi:hypothetical protein